MTESLLHLFKLLNEALDISNDVARKVTIPCFAISLIPYAVFVYFLQLKQTKCPKGVVLGFATCLIFAVNAIMGAARAKRLYGFPAEKCDWIHGFNQSILTVTNIVTIVAFHQAMIEAKSKKNGHSSSRVFLPSLDSYLPTTLLYVILMTISIWVGAIVPRMGEAMPEAHTPWLYGIMDSKELTDFLKGYGARPEPEESMTVGSWVCHLMAIHLYHVIMDYTWRWAKVSNNPRWKNLTWAMVPLYANAVTPVVAHFFYDAIPIMKSIQAVLVVVGNIATAYATYQIARSNGWACCEEAVETAAVIPSFTDTKKCFHQTHDYEESIWMLLGRVLLSSTILSYILKYGATLFQFPLDAPPALAVLAVLVCTMLNIRIWYLR